MISANEDDKDIYYVNLYRSTQKDVTYSFGIAKHYNLTSAITDMTTKHILTVTGSKRNAMYNKPFIITETIRYDKKIKK